jgi:hypothetical protein
VPGVVLFQYWIAQSTRHWRCEAFRLPDGTWDGFPNNFGVGGAVPGCYPPRLDSPIWVSRLRTAWPGGFYYDDVQIPLAGGRARRIEYGVTLTGGRAVRVRDIFSGASAPVIDGLYFAILLPPFDRTKTVAWQFQALDASGTCSRPGSAT